MIRLLPLMLVTLAHAGETLPSGIVLPDEWPPRAGGHAGTPPLETWKKPGDPPEPPYLKTKPAVIHIDTGRQLLVDDFLIASTTLKRVWHSPVKHVGNPVLKAEKPWETGSTRTPMAAPFSDGCFYDPLTKRFMLWYSSGWYDSTALAVSRDGLQWERPEFDVFPGTNKVMLFGAHAHRHRDGRPGKFVFQVRALPFDDGKPLTSERHAEARRSGESATGGRKARKALAAGHSTVTRLPVG